MRSHYCGDVNETLDGKTVTIAGWMHRRRDHGGVIFILSYSLLYILMHWCAFF